MAQYMVHLESNLTVVVATVRRMTFKEVTHERQYVLRDSGYSDRG